MLQILKWLWDGCTTPLFRSKDHWLKEYLKDQDDPIIEINGEVIPTKLRTTEGEFKRQIEAATQTLPTGLSFAELNTARVELGDVEDPAGAIDPEDADGIREALAQGDLYGSAAYLRQLKKERKYIADRLLGHAGDDLNVQEIAVLKPLVFKGSTQGCGEDGKLPVIDIEVAEQPCCGPDDPCRCAAGEPR